MRYGEVRFDHWLLYGKVSTINIKLYLYFNKYFNHSTFLNQVVDLPTIVESMKTIDNKSFYKTADICQVRKTFEVLLYIKQCLCNWLILAIYL